MKENKKYSTSYSKISKVIYISIVSIKKAAFEKYVKKIGVLLMLLFAINVVKGFTDEVVGEIMFPPQYNGNYRYSLDTTGDKITDRNLGITYRNSFEAFEILPKYLKEGWKVVFEDKGLKPFEDFSANRMIAIISPDGQYIELTRLFSLDVIQYYFPHLWEKLKREGRAK